MTIKYLVLGGGGAGGFSIYGALKYLSQNNFWNINNIKSIYSTSIGSLISIFISLNYDWTSLDDYIIKRPWDKVLSIKPIDLLNIWSKKGLFDENTIKEVLRPLLTAKYLSESITLKEFYEYNNIEIHMYTVNINDKIPTEIDMTYKTHPDLELYKAITRSSAFPILFTPICDNSHCYVDGGLINNFPLNSCISNDNNCDEILAFKSCTITTKINIIEDSSIINYLFCLIHGIIKLAATEKNQDKIKNIVECYLDSNNLNNWKDAILYEKTRKEMVLAGEKCGRLFFENMETNKCRERVASPGPTHQDK